MIDIPANLRGSDNFWAREMEIWPDNHLVYRDTGTDVFIQGEEWYAIPELWDWPIYRSTADDIRLICQWSHFHADMNLYWENIE